MRKQVFFYSLVLLLIIITYYNSFHYSSSSNFIYPTNYTDISSEYGFRILYGNSNFHNGIDFLAPENSEIFAANSGYVEYVGFLESGYGNTIIISHQNGYRSLYCHVAENFIVDIGQYVKQGEVIGYVGPKYLSNGVMNGNTTGPHLHFSIFVNGETIDPISVLP